MANKNTMRRRRELAHEIGDKRQAALRRAKEQADAKAAMAAAAGPMTVSL